MGWPLTSTNWVMSSSPHGGMNYWLPADWVSWVVVRLGCTKLPSSTRKTERQKDRGVVRRWLSDVSRLSSIATKEGNKNICKLASRMEEWVGWVVVDSGFAFFSS